LGLAAGLIAAFAAGRLVSESPITGLGAFAATAQATDDGQAALELFAAAFKTVRDDYVDKPDGAKLVAAAINGMLSSLDPHSSYFDAKAMSEMQTTGQEFAGLGIDVTRLAGQIEVVSPIDDAPAAKAGVLPGDIIAAIDDESTQGMTLSQAVAKMRGAAKSTVRLKILRGETKEVREFTLVRDVIKVTAVRVRVESGTIGYLRVTQFNQLTFDGLQKAFERLKNDPGQDKLTGYILDLRNNPGGLLTQSIEVANAFLEKGEIVTVRGRNAESAQRYDARPALDLSAGKPLVVLINGGSAAAAEIVAGALHDQKRAIILGTRSFGFGTVQTVLPLGQGGAALRLTTARYYTPSGRSIQAAGIEPDTVVTEDVPAGVEGSAGSEASPTGHLPNGREDTVTLQSYVPPNPKDDRQLIAAIDIVRSMRR
jgi:carboxyl-terminal processing protease